MSHDEDDPSVRTASLLTVVWACGPVAVAAAWSAVETEDSYLLPFENSRLPGWTEDQMEALFRWKGMRRLHASV